MASLHRITIFPMKALNGVHVGEAAVLPSGALLHDRRFAIHDSDGNFVNGKREPRVHLLRASYSPNLQNITLRIQERDPAPTFHLRNDRSGLAEWLTAYFGQPVEVRENPDGGFPDDLDSPGPTVVSTATLETVASWFPRLTVEEVRDRFRANLEIGGVEPFWEDRLFGEPGQAVAFQVGGIRFDGINPCQRCIVPTRDPSNGEVISGFQKTFTQRRQATLPAWAAASRFNHFYRLAVNTRLTVGQERGTIKPGDEVRVP